MVKYSDGAGRERNGNIWDQIRFVDGMNIGREFCESEVQTTKQMVM